jgi:hypothetical protein
MRFMMMAISPGYRSAAPGTPGPEARMPRYNRSLQMAGVLLAADELFPPRTAASISRLNGELQVGEGFEAQPKERIGRYWIIQVRTREEAIEWALRVPLSDNERIELRQIREISAAAEGPVALGQLTR